MSEIKTPLELANHIKDRSAKLFEVRRIAKALSDISRSADIDTMRTIVRSFSLSLAELASDNSDNYWDVCNLIVILEKAVMEETANVEDDLPFVTPDGGDSE